MALILALDQGTTSTRAFLFRPDGSIVARGSSPVPAQFPQPGWVEQDPMALVASAREAIAQALAGRPRGEKIACAGLTNQRETVVLWERDGGRPVYPAIVWQCRRTADLCRALARQGLEPWIRERTGLVLDPYFSATKLRWLLELPGVRGRAERGELAAGTVDSWLIYALAGGGHRTEPSNASRTLLLHLRTLAWDPELLALFGVPEAVLPEVLPSCAEFGALDLEGERVPLVAVLGDQQAALFGHGAVRPGEGKCTYGTGAFLLVHAGSEPPVPPPGILATCAWARAAERVYALEGSDLAAGAAVDWLVGLGLAASAAELDRLALAAPAGGDEVFVPALAGLGTPHWDPAARGLLAGLGRGTTRERLARAALEGVACRVAEMLQAMGPWGSRREEPLTVDGGLSRSRALLQAQADLAGRPVERLAQEEATAWGVAAMAAMHAGLMPWGRAQPAEAGERFLPRLGEAERQAHLTRFRRAVAAARELAGG